MTLTVERQPGQTLRGQGGPAGRGLDDAQRQEGARGLCGQARVADQLSARPERG
jgi:hypothetical protein